MHVTTTSVYVNTVSVQKIPQGHITACVALETEVVPAPLVVEPPLACSNVVVCAPLGSRGQGCSSVHRGLGARVVPQVQVSEHLQKSRFTSLFGFVLSKN